MASLMNGLSAAGQGVASFAGAAGLEAQKAQLAQDSMRLADSLATTRESFGRQESGQIAATAADKQQAFTSGENALTRTAEMARTNVQGQTSRDVANIGANAEPESIKVLRALGLMPASSSAPAPPASTSGSNSGAAQAPSSVSGDASGGPAPPKSIDVSTVLAKVLGQPMPGSEDAIRRAIAGGVVSDPAFKDKSPSEQAAEIKKRLASASASLSSDALDTIADRTIAGDTSALTGLGYGEGGAANRAAAQERITEKLKAKGMGGGDLAASIAAFGGEKAGARTAGTREANVGMAVAEAQLFMPLALDASKAVSRTQFPTLNSIIQAAEKGTGDENVVRLAVATNSLVNAYSRAITPSGIPTEGNQARARELLDKAWSQGQYAAAIDQLSKEMQGAKASPVQQQQEQRARISGKPTPDSTPQTGPATPPRAPAGTPLADPLGIR